MSINKKEIINRFKKKHGNKFDYTKFNYRTIRDHKSSIICIKHNLKFEISAQDHIRYKFGGCSRCAKESQSKNQRMNIGDYIDKANLIHNFKYDYSMVHQFKNQHENINIICPIHGEFKKEAANHINKRLKQGCPSCGYESGGKKLRSNKNNFIQKSLKIHGDFYIYNYVIYKTDRDLVKIICPVHGEFEQVARNHLDGYGCKDCGKIKSGNTSRKSSASKFIKIARKIHGNKFNYKNLKWVNSDTPVEIICRRCGPFWIIPHNHTSPSLKRGCTICGKKMRIKQNLWLDYLGIPNDKKHREVSIKINGVNFKPDGFDKKTMTIYEFNGDYWHGNPIKFKKNKINPSVGVKFGFLFEKTKVKQKIFTKAGYKVVDIWESEWDKLQNKIQKK